MKGNWFERKWGSDPVFVAVAPSTIWTCGREGTRQWKSQDSNILCRPLCSFENNMIYIYITSTVLQWCRRNFFETFVPATLVKKWGTNLFSRRCPTKRGHVWTNNFFQFRGPGVHIKFGALCFYHKNLQVVRPINAWDDAWTSRCGVQRGNDLEKISSDIKLFADDFAYLAFQSWAYSCWV